MRNPFDFARIAAEPMDSRHRDGGTLICDGPSDALATVHLYRGQDSHDSAVALFTAAPGMLAVLESALDAWRDSFESDSEINGADFLDWFSTWRESAVAAVAAAKGAR